MDSSEKLSRRDFFKRSTSLTAATALSGIWITSSSLKSCSSAKKVKFVSPNEKVNLACVGIGNRGGEITREFAKTNNCNIVALCDVDMGAPHTVQNMKMFPQAKQFQDFRKMFDEMGDQIDAVAIGIPDFAHFPVAMLAMSLGKHVYVEKPLSKNIL
jgi:Predicted dehydrogenases and related proteins